MTSALGTIHCEIDRLEGSLPRLIGLIERRGFEIDTLALGVEGNENRRVAMDVRGRGAGRCIEVLGRQIDRLHGVRRLHGEIVAFGGEAGVCVP